MNISALTLAAVFVQLCPVALIKKSGLVNLAVFCGHVCVDVQRLAIRHHAATDQ